MTEKIEENLSKFKQKIFRSNKNLENKGVSGYRLIIELTSGLAVGVFFGYYTDKYLHTIPFFLFFGSIFGIAAGGYNAYNTFKK